MPVYFPNVYAQQVLRNLGFAVDREGLLVPPLPFILRWGLSLYPVLSNWLDQLTSKPWESTCFPCTEVTDLCYPALLGIETQVLRPLCLPSAFVLASP